MDALGKLLLFVCSAVLFLFAIACVDKALTPPEPKPVPLYCVDPFTSEDLGTQTWTHCSLVPMWSIKV